MGSPKRLVQPWRSYGTHLVLRGSWTKDTTRNEEESPVPEARADTSITTAPARITILAYLQRTRWRRPGWNREPVLCWSSWCTLRDLGKAGVSRRMRKDCTVGQQHRELEAARVAIVSLLAVTTDEQIRAVETALKGLEPMYERARGALDEMRIAGRHRRPTGGQGQDMRQAIEAHLARLDRSR